MKYSSSYYWPTPTLSFRKLRRRAAEKCESFFKWRFFLFLIVFIGKEGRKRETPEETFLYNSFLSYSSSSSTGPSGKIPSILQDIGTEIEGGERRVQRRTPSESFGQFWRLQWNSGSLSLSLSFSLSLSLCVCVCVWASSRFVNSFRILPGCLKCVATDGRVQS